MLRHVIILVVLALGATHAHARANDENKRERVREKVRTIVAARIVEVLDLDEKTSTKLFPVLNKYQDQIADVQKDNGKARRELKQLLDGGKADDKAIDKLTDRMLANKAKIAKLEEEMFKEVRKILTPTQSAKLVVLLPRLRNQIEHKMREAVQKRRGGGGSGKDLDWDDDDL